MAGKRRAIKISNIRKSAHRGVDRVMNKAESLNKRGRNAVSRFNKKTRGMERDVGSYVQRNVDKAMNKAGSMRKRGGKTVARFNKKANKMREDVDSYVKKNPKKSLSIAAGIGAFIGLIFATIMGRRR